MGSQRPGQGTLQHLSIGALSQRADAKEALAQHAAERHPLIGIVGATIGDAGDEPEEAVLRPASARSSAAGSDGFVADLLGSDHLAEGLTPSEWRRLATIHAEFELFRKRFRIKYPLPRAGFLKGDPDAITDAVRSCMRSTVRSKDFILHRVQKSIRAVRRTQRWFRWMLERRESKMAAVVGYWEAEEGRTREHIKSQIGEVGRSTSLGRLEQRSMKQELAHSYATWCAVGRALKERAVKVVYESRRAEVHSRLRGWMRTEGAREVELREQYRRHRRVVAEGTTEQRAFSEARMRQLWAELTLLRVEAPRLVFDQRTVSLAELEGVAKGLVMESAGVRFPSEEGAAPDAAAPQRRRSSRLLSGTSLLRSGPASEAQRDPRTPEEFVLESLERRRSARRRSSPVDAALCRRSSRSPSLRPLVRQPSVGRDPLPPPPVRRAPPLPDEIQSMPTLSRFAAPAVPARRVRRVPVRTDSLRRPLGALAAPL